MASSNLLGAYVNFINSGQAEAGLVDQGGKAGLLKYLNTDLPAGTLPATSISAQDITEHADKDARDIT